MSNKYKIILLVVSIYSGLNAQDPEEFFAKNCFSCHTIGGGRLTGPDLKNVSERKDAAWLEKFILNPQAVINSGDNYAASMLRNSRGVVMPQVTGLNVTLTRALLKFIKTESGLEKSFFAGSTINDRPLTAADIILGRELFLGVRRLENRGPTCLGCHTIAGEGALGGGLLGPDLTQAYGRLGGKISLAAWLSNPASVTMSPIYKTAAIAETEILPLVAFMKSKAEGKIAASTVHDFNFMIFGFIGLVFILVIFDLVWGKRFRSIRKMLVKGELK